MIQTNAPGQRFDGRDANDQRFAAHTALGPETDHATHIMIRHDGHALLAPHEARALAHWILATIDMREQP